VHNKGGNEPQNRVTDFWIVYNFWEVRQIHIQYKIAKEIQRLIMSIDLLAYFPYLKKINVDLWTASVV
jgi:hypothetical protein